MADKLRLRAEGRLPERREQAAAPAPDLPSDDVARAREGLDAALATAMDRIAEWHAADLAGDAPQIGIRATVGLGKSVAARRHLRTLRVRLAEQGAPDRLLVLVPSHMLAEETAAEWRDAGQRAAVLRGYEARDPGDGSPMCRDLAAVRMAVAAGRDVQVSVCDDGSGRRCRHFASCRKQANRREVTAADVVVAPYDVLYTGLALDCASIGCILIDEACWQRAIDQDRSLALDDLDDIAVHEVARFGAKVGSAARMADLVALRRKLREAFLRNGRGPVDRRWLREAGVSIEDARAAAALERMRLQDPGLHPGMTAAQRGEAASIAAANARVQAMIDLWDDVTDLLFGPVDRNGRIVVEPGEGGKDRILRHSLKRLHVNLRDKPVLHLDATLRPDIAQTILPGLEVTTIEATAPHATLRLVTGRFGKAALAPRAPAGAAHLADCVDYVRWQAARHPDGRVLVVTYKACEAAFAGIDRVDVAHFNAIAGLDRYRDVRLLIVVGRPLPRDTDLAPLAGALFGREAAGGYQTMRAGIRMRDGSERAVPVVAHEDPRAEAIRAAICDDEVIQAIGRGRAVNRTAQTPLEIHLLANLALPLVHDELRAWETEAPGRAAEDAAGGTCSGQSCRCGGPSPGAVRGRQAGPEAVRTDRI